MDQPRTVINLEETIGKTVGRRRPPTDPLKVSDSNIKRAIEFQKAFPSKVPKKSGVFRFHTHAEADLWMTKHTMPS